MGKEDFKDDNSSINQLNNLRSGDSSSHENSDARASGASGIFSSFVDSFKPAIGEKTLTHVENKENMSRMDMINANAANSNLSRKLKNRHLQMIAIGLSIGSGLFVGTGSALRTGGPAGVMIGWAFTATGVYATMQGLGELAITFPVSGSFNLFASRFIEPAIGFAVGWNYFMQFYVLLPLELVAGAITVQYWTTSIDPDVFVAVLWVAILIITLLGVRGYGEMECFFSLVKVIAVVGFLILSIVLICGGGPTHDYIGGRNWRHPGPFANGFKGVCSVLVTAAFSFGGTEMVGLTAAETQQPSKILPKAIKRVFWRICIFYLGSLVMIGTLVNYNDERLMGESSNDTASSPFVIAVVNGGIKGLPSVMNAVIMIAVLSVGNASVYATSRSLNSLAEQGMAPKWTGYVDRAGRPLAAILLTDGFGLLAFIATSDKREDVFNWLLALSGLSSIFTWLSINVSHLRFRRAMTVQGRSLDELPYLSQAGVWGSVYGAGFNLLVLGLQFWIALFPIKEKPNASAFFQVYLGLPVVLLSWLIYKVFWSRNDWTLFIRAKDIDVDSGRPNIDIDLIQQEKAEEKARIAEKPFYYRWYQFWC